MMRRPSSHFGFRRPIERDSRKTFDLLGRKKRAIKGMAISDDLGGVRHNSVVFWSVSETCRF